MRSSERREVGRAGRAEVAVEAEQVRRAWRGALDAENTEAPIFTEHMGDPTYDGW